MTNEITRRLIKSNFETSYWWKFVSPEVKVQINFIIDNLDVIGLLFRHAYRHSCEYEHQIRSKNKINIDKSEGTILFAELLSEENYLSSIPATKSLLKLDDWHKPNEAEVYACRFLCDQIDVLQLDGLKNLANSKTG